MISLLAAPSPNGVVFLVDVDALLSDPVRSKAFGTPEQVKKTAAKGDFSFDLTDSKGGKFHVVFLERDPARRAQRDAERVQGMRDEVREKVAEAVQYKEGDYRRGARLSKARDLLDSASLAEQWFARRGPETWKAYLHEQYAHPFGEALEASDEAEGIKFPHSTEYYPAIMEHRWVGW